MDFIPPGGMVVNHDIERSLNNPLFALHAPSLYSAGMATIPLGEKDPLISGFNKWKRRPQRTTVDKWCERFSDANIGYIPGLTFKRRLIIVDNDGGAREQIEATFGKTPGMVITRRGDHHIYREPPGYEGRRINLRALGINADWKHGNDIVVGPGSVHKSGHIYSWRECDERVLRDLPVIDLRQVIKQNVPVLSQEELKAKAGFRNASRECALNDHLCKHCPTIENEAIGLAYRWNNGLSERGIEKLSDERVMQIAQTFCRDVKSRKVKPGHGGRAVLEAKRTGHEIDALTEVNLALAPQAFFMLHILRIAHGARCERGETFAVTPKAMAAAGTIPGFTKYMIETCRDMLLDAGLIKLVAPMKNGNQRKAAQYRLSPLS